MDLVTIFLILCLLLTVGISIGYLREINAVWKKGSLLPWRKPPVVSDDAEGEKSIPTPPSAEKTQRIQPKLLILYLLTGVLVLLGLLDLLPAIDYGAYAGGFLLLGVTALLEFLVYQFCLRKKSRTIRFFGKLLVIAAVLELTIMQFPSYHLLLGDYPLTTLSVSDAQIEMGNAVLDTNSDTIQITGKDECVLTYSDLNLPVGSVYIKARFSKGTDCSSLVLDACDATHAEYRYDFAKSKLIKDRENSSYVSCLLSGDVTKLRIKFTGTNDTDSLTLQGIQLNRQIPFAVSPLRFLLFLILGTLAYAIACSSVLAKPYEYTKRICGGAAAVMTAVVMLLGTMIVLKELPDGGVKEQLRLSYGNQITKELVDAFEDGHLYLEAEPSQELMELENPYDWSVRSSQDVRAEWDHVYFDGKYYSYYGIAPVVLLYLPWHKLTGHYASTNLSVLLFGLIGMLFLTLTYMAAVKRWFRKTPAGCIIAGLAVLLSACGIWYSLGRTLFYEISISSGFAFITMGAYCLISSNLLAGNQKISLPRTALTSLFLGLAVLCRPTLAVYSICAVVFFLFAIPRAGHVLEEGAVIGVNKIRRTSYILCAAVPLAALGVVQMWYNAARFGSPFDFGIQYSLTINDFTHSQYHTHFVLIGLWNYLFAPCLIQPEHPFISTPLSILEANGYYFTDAGNTSGILFLALPVLAYFVLSRSALRRLPDRKTKLKNLLFIGLPCVIMPLVIICSIWESGYAVRYTADFSWEIIFGALIILFYLYQESRNDTKKQWMKKFMAISMIAAIVINGVQIFNFAFPINDYPALADHLIQLIAFWK